MSPTPLPPLLSVERVLKDLEQNPPDELELRILIDPRNPWGDPDLALALENQVPRWWPRRNPNSGKLLSAEQRRRWFLDALAGELKPDRQTLLSGSERSRRRIVAQSLLRMQSDWNPAEIPTPDWL